MELEINKSVRKNLIKLVINENADVYGENGDLLLKFRKNALKINHTNMFYDNIIDYAKKTTTSNRSISNGEKGKNIATAKKVHSSIIGFFDLWAPSQKVKFKKLGLKIPIEIRETYFNTYYPDKFEKVVPLIKDIDTLYKKLLPKYYKNQCEKAREIPFKISNTTFTTATINVNYQTHIHKDAGDFNGGFGNLIVIEKGKYTGGETCFPQYGIGVNVRTNDILFMNVHEFHGNLPMKLEKDAIRLSVVCYLREKIWARGKGKSKKFMEKHFKLINKTLKNTN